MVFNACTGSALLGAQLMDAGLAAAYQYSCQFVVGGS